MLKVAFTVSIRDFEKDPEKYLSRLKKGEMIVLTDTGFPIRVIANLTDIDELLDRLHFHKIVGS